MIMWYIINNYQRNYIEIVIELLQGHEERELSVRYEDSFRTAWLKI